MSRTPTILPLIANLKKHTINPANLATWTHASIATTKGHPRRKDDRLWYSTGQTLLLGLGTGQ
ncbi:unnamed protein product [Prunus armeniaca]